MMTLELSVYVEPFYRHYTLLSNKECSRREWKILLGLTVIERIVKLRQISKVNILSLISVIQMYKFISHIQRVLWFRVSLQ